MNSSATSNPTPVPKSLPLPPEDWVEVEAALIRSGVGKTDDAIKTALRNDVAPHDVIAIVEYAESKPGVYGPGAIFNRIESHRPGQSFNVGWPVEDNEFTRRREVEAKRERRSREQLAHEVRKRQQDADRREAKRLEQEHGPTLDNMSDNERTAFAEKHLDKFQMTRFRQDPTKPIVRETLLLALEKQ